MHDLFNKAFDFCKSVLTNAPEAGHDWQHTLRVLHLSETIALSEPGNKTTIQLGALFHDIADSKFNDGNDDKGWQTAQTWMNQNDIEEITIEKITHLIKNISWHKKYQYSPAEFPELAVVQDADRLDAIGAIGIARAFSFGGYKKRPLYSTSENETDSTLSHFHEKLIHIKDSMNTPTGKKLAEERHQFMMQFIQKFEQEIKIN